MAICLNLKEPVLLLLLIVITSVLSGDLMQLLETLKEDEKNSEESNKFVRTVLEHKNDLEWIEKLGQQYRGIRDTLQSDEDLVNCNWNPSNNDQYNRRIQDRSNHYKYKFRQNNNRYSPYAFSPYSTFDNSGRDKRQSIRYEYRPQIRVTNNGLTGVLRPYNLKHVPYKRKSDNINDAEEQKVMNIDHEKELQKMESKPNEEYHDILGLRDYSQKEEIMEENKEYLKTSTAISESQHKNKRYGNSFDSNEHILFPKWNRMLKKSTGYYNSNPDCDNGKCANVNSDKMGMRDIDIPERNTGDADQSMSNKDIVQAIFDPECTSCSTDNTNQFQIMVLPKAVATRAHEINPTMSPIVVPIIMKSPMPTELDLNSEQDTHKIIQKKEIAANHSSLTEVPFVTNPPIDIIHSKNYHNFVPEKDIYIDTNKFNANTEENLLKDILGTEKYVPEYGPLHIARIQPATAEPAHVFSFEYASQKAMEDKAMLNEMTEEEKQKAAEEAHKLMEVDKDFNERNEPELDAKSDVDLPETKDASKSNTQNSDVNFKSRSLKYIDMDKEEGEYLPYMDYYNNYRYANRHTKRSNAKEVIQNGLKKLKKIFGFGNDKLEYEEVTDVYPFDEVRSNIINEDFNDYEYVPKHRDKTVHRKYHRIKEGNGHKNVKVHKSPRLTHQNRKYLTDIRKKYKADECTESTPKTTTASCITTSTTPSTTTTTQTTTACTTPTTTPSTTTTARTTTACTTPTTTTTSAATCTNSANPATTINNMEVIDEKDDDYLADENEQEACTEPTTEHIHFGPTANVSCEGTPNKKNEEMQIKNNEDLMDVTGAGHSTIASVTTENLATTTVYEVTSPITNTEVSSISISESTTATVSVTATTASSGESTTEVAGTAGTISSGESTTEVSGTIVSEGAGTTVSEAAPTTSSKATSTTGSEAASVGTTVSEVGPNGVSEVVPTTVSENAETIASTITGVAVSETTTTISEIVTTLPETSTVSEEATTLHEHTTPNVMSTEHTNTSETTTHKTATTHITDDKEHENKSNKPVVEDFPEDLSMDKKLHETTTEVAHTTSHEGNVTHAEEEDATVCTETGDDAKRKRKKSVHEAAGSKRNIRHSGNFSKMHSKRSKNNKHLQRKDSNISHSRISKKHHKRNNVVINRHRKRALDTASKQNNDENEDMHQEKLKTIPVLTKFNNKEDEDMTDDNNEKITQQRGNYESKRTNNNFRYRANRYGPNRFSLNRYIPRNKRHHFEHYNNNHPKIRTRRSNHMLPVNKYSSSQSNIISQETAQDVEDDDLNNFVPVEFESQHFKNPFTPEQLNENINYKEIKNGFSQQKNTQHVGGRSMHLSKRNYDANFQQTSAENMSRRNLMDVNNEGKNEHITNARDTSHNDGSIDTYLKDEALKGQLAAQIVESIFNEVESSGQLKKHIGPGLDKGHKTKPVSNQGKSDKHQNEVEEKQLENMQENIMKSLNKLIDEQLQRKTCVPLDPESMVFLEQLTSRQNNLAKSHETELDMKATDKPPHQETFLFEEPQKAKGNNNTHHGTVAVPGVQTTPDLHNKQTTQSGHRNESQTGHGNQNEGPNQNEVTTQHGLNTSHTGLNTENVHTTENGQHAELATVQHNTEHITQVTTHPTILQSPISQHEHDGKHDSTTCSEDAKIDIFTPEHVSSFQSEPPHMGSTEQGLSPEHGLSAEHGLSTEHRMLTEPGLLTEHGLSTEHRLLIEREVSTEHGLSTESSKTNTDTKEMEDKKEGVKRLMTMYNELPENDRHKFCSVYQYLHKQNIFLARVIRQIRKSTRSARYSQEYFENRRHRYPFYDYPRNEYVPRHYQQYYKPRHQIWSQQYVSNDPQTPSDKYMKLVKRAMYYRRKREAEERLKKRIQMNTTGKIKKLEQLPPVVTTGGMEDLTFNYSNA